MSLATDMTAFVTKARARLREAPREVLSAVAADLIANTPVDTGQLRASWGIATGAFADAAALAAAGVTHADLDIDVGTDPSGQATIARLQAFTGQIEPGSVVSFVNTAPYAEFVEYGTVHMAPRAFVRRTIARIPAITAQVLGASHGQP